MLMLSICLWLLISVIMNLSGNLIGINGLIYIILLILVLSPIVCFYIFYNLVISHINYNSIVYVLSYKFVSFYSYSIYLNISISVLSMLVVILLICVSYSINIYIFKYMYKDFNVLSFISLIQLFTFSMIILIISSDIILLFIGWEMIGITSLLLIGYYNSRIEAVKSGLKAIMYNRIGDLFFLLSIVLSINLYSSNVISLYSVLISYSVYSSNSICLLIGISLIISAWSKSTQLGFQPWLLDAMEGPTPVSALLHSATLVTAGILLLYKNLYIFYFNNSLCMLIIILGCLSTILNSISSISYLDIKRIIAYSTCTHISLIIMILGISAISNSISLFHLFYHGWSKSLIFMLSGYLISLIHSQDLRYFGNLFLSIPIQFVFMCISLLTIFGFPGSYLSNSKDIILEFGLLSIYGYSMFLIFVIIVLLSQGYSLGLLLYLFCNSSYYSNSSYMSNSSVYIFVFFYLIVIILYFPIVIVDIVCYYNLTPLHNIIGYDIFSLISLLGIILCYCSVSFDSVVYLFNIHNNRLYMDKLISSISSYFSVYVIYYFQYMIEYGFIMHYHVIQVLICFCIFLI